MGVSIWPPPPPDGIWSPPPPDRMLSHLLLSTLSLVITGSNGHNPHLKHHRDTDIMIREAGYTAETHTVITQDGYILKIHRIVGEGPVVFMQHGLMDASSTWVVAGPDHGGPAFRMAEQGYDVWLGNFRGNHYSRNHETLDPDSSPEFWMFSWDEMAKYDLPTMLHYVMETTGQEKIYYFGHSMGTTTYMAMNSMDPSWADKVELAVFLAPVAYTAHMESPIRLLAPFTNQVQWITEFLGIGEFLPSNWILDWLADHVCADSYLEFICENIVFLMAGYDEAQMNKTMLPSVMSHLPSGTSTYTVLQYAQEIKHENFGGFDWGSEELNRRHHGSDTPPVYDLSRVNTKVALIWGDNDWLVSKEDLLKIISHMQDIAEIYQIPWTGWSHFDFLYAIDVDLYQNNHLIDLLAKHPIA